MHLAFARLLVVVLACGQLSAAWAGVRVTRERDGTLVLSNRSGKQRRARVVMDDDGALRVILRGGVQCTPRPDRGQYDAFFTAAEQAHKVPMGLLKAVAWAESAFDPQAVSKVGAQGLMQLMPATAAELSVADPFDPAQAIAGGARYLRMMLDRFEGDVTLALAAYNAGPDAVERHQGVPPYEETQRYVKRVLEWYRKQSGDDAPLVI